MNIGKSISVALAQNDMQKKELAEALGVTPATISNLVKSPTCSGRALDNLCEVFEMKASEFIALGE